MLYKDLIKELEKFDKTTGFDSNYKFKKNIFHYNVFNDKYTIVSEMIHLLELIHPKGFIKVHHLDEILYVIGIGYHTEYTDRLTFLVQRR